MYKRITPMRRDILPLKQASGPLVYIAWKGPQCLYIGMSSRGLARPFTNPKVLKSGATDLELRWCVDIEAARSLESRLIFDLRPPLNKNYSAGGTKLALLTIRVFESDLAEWKRKANLRGLNLSEWIRRQCNEAQTISEQVNGDGSTDNQNVPRVAGTNPAQRRSAAGKRGFARSLARRSNRMADNPRMDETVRDRVADTQSVVGAAGDSSFGVTRENFAETMALVKPDEVDYWARQLDPAILPPHDGKAAAQNKCVCRHCLEKRKTLGIWYGYESKGKKK